MENSERNNVKDGVTPELIDLEESEKKNAVSEAVSQRDIKSKDNQDEEECINDEDFMNQMDVVDAWEGDEDRLKEDSGKKNYLGISEKRLISRERRRRLERRAESREREKDKERLRREERKREPLRRDPTKSNKDIERDKLRAKKDSDSKLLAEKERAIKHILDSDDVVPPGTEEDAIDIIVEKQQESSSRRKSSEKYSRISPGSRRRRVSPYRSRRTSYRRSPLQMSPSRRRSPFISSPDRKRSPNHRRSPICLSPDRPRSIERRRRSSWDRRSNTERRWSSERQKRRSERERDLKLSNRRSRSRERHRSPSSERRKRYSRSPRRRSHSRSRSPDRRRKRSPFINEIARQLRNEMEVASTLNRGYNAPVTAGVIPGAPVTPGPPRIPGINAPPGMSIPGDSARIPGVPFVPFDPRPPGGIINYEQMPSHLHPVEFPPGPPGYGAQSHLAPSPMSAPLSMQGPTTILAPSGLPLPCRSPQPVPAPGPLEHPTSIYLQPQAPASQISVNNKLIINQPSSQSSYRDRGTPFSPYSVHEVVRDERRLKTPEPPVISDSKRFEKTSLSSLLEASVSSRDSKNHAVLYPGFRPEIIRHCEYALRDLPPEDPRLKMKGRFFFDPSKGLTSNEINEEASNSILLRKGKNKIDWEELEDTTPPLPKPIVQMHQKICQTDELEVTSMGIQTTINISHIGIQVYPADLQISLSQTEKRPVTDRLDWNLRETYDYNNTRDSDDLRWNLNSSQKRAWNRAVSPERSLRSDLCLNPGTNLSSNLNLGPSLDHYRTINMDPSMKERDPFTGNRTSVLDHLRAGNYGSSFNRNAEERVNYRDERGGNFRDERGGIFRDDVIDSMHAGSPMVLDDHQTEEIEFDHGGFSRDSSIGPGKSSSLFFKSRPSREMPMAGRSNRGNFRGKHW